MIGAGRRKVSAGFRIENLDFGPICFDDRSPQGSRIPRPLRNPTGPLGDRWFRGTPSQESFFPEFLFPLGRGFNPFPTPPRGPWSGGLRIVRALVGAPQPFQERSQNPSFISFKFEANLVTLWLPKWIPEAPTKSVKSQPKHEKYFF